jgi:hypothetical protein
VTQTSQDLIRDPRAVKRPCLRPAADGLVKVVAGRGVYVIERT